MKLFTCHWPNGEVSIVYADDVAEAVFILDELAGADPAWVKPWPNRQPFFVTMAPFKPELPPDDEDAGAYWVQADELPDGIEDTIGDADAAWDAMQEKAARAKNVRDLPTLEERRTREILRRAARETDAAMRKTDAPPDDDKGDASC